MARNPQALHFKFYVEYDTEIIRQAEQYNNFAELNKFNYKIPVVIFNFRYSNLISYSNNSKIINKWIRISNGITQQLASHLSKFIQVQVYFTFKNSIKFILCLFFI